MRRQALEAAIAGRWDDGEREEYRSPWTDRRVGRSWIAMAGAPDPRYTSELVESLRASAIPKLLV